MRLVSYRSDEGIRIAAEVGGMAVDLNLAHQAQLRASDRVDFREPWEHRERANRELPSDMMRFLEADKGAWDRARAIVEAWKSLPEVLDGRRVLLPLDQLRLAAPVPKPYKLIGIGLNYSDHAAESNMKVPDEPIFFAKFANTVIAPDEPIVYPSVTNELDYEVELAFVIGKPGKRILEERALEHVFGYTVINDVSARDLQFKDGHWIKGKTLDTFSPMGPALVTADEIPDPQRLRLTLDVNGERKQNGSTDKMIFGVASLVAYLSTLMTLEPGDVVFTGTPPGVGFGRRPQVYLKPGDVVNAWVEGIGTLTNPIVREE